MMTDHLYTESCFGSLITRERYYIPQISMGSIVIGEMVHVLVVSFPAQGHTKPMLKLAKGLASKGLLVTFTTTDHIGNMIKKANNYSDDTDFTVGQGKLRFEFFSDGWALNEPKRQNMKLRLEQLEKAGKESLSKLIRSQTQIGRPPIACLISNPLVPWVTDLGTELGIPCTMLWVHACATLSVYFHYLNHLTPFPTIEHPETVVNLPGLPTLEPKDLPEFLYPTCPVLPLRDVALAQVNNLPRTFCVLINSFEELEHDILSGLQSRFKSLSLSIILRPIGPVSNDLPSRDNISGDMWSATEGSLEFLDSQPPASVVYVSFGTIVALTKEQLEEIAWGLLNSGVPFLWALNKPEEILFIEGLLKNEEVQLTGKGMIVQWCPQDQVLAHSSLACHVSHCGWGSTMESLAYGVPVIGFGHLSDQTTNAKLLESVFGVGIRMKVDEEKKMVMRDEVERCVLEAAKGEKAMEMKKNAVQIKKMASEAVAEGGSSDLNFDAFVDDLKKMACNGSQVVQQQEK